MGDSTTPQGAELLHAELFEFAPAPYVVTDMAGVVRQANRAACRLLGIDAELDPPASSLVPPMRLTGQWDPTSLHSDRLTAREVVVDLPDGDPVVVMATVARRPAHVGRPHELLWLFRDVMEERTDHTALEDELARSRAEREELRELDRWKDAFLAAAAHDLHAPLRGIETIVRTLVSSHELGAAQPLVEAVGHEAQRLSRLLDDLLDLDRFTRGLVTADRRSTDLHRLVDQAVAHAIVDDDLVEIDVPTVTVDVEPTCTSRIVTNLVENAASHTPSGTPIRVIGRVEGDAVELVVEDRGPGVPAHLREEVFHPFVTRRAHDRDHVGTGLGLSLVRLFAELHGGTAHIEDVPGGGMRVVVHLEGS